MLSWPSNSTQQISEAGSDLAQQQIATLIHNNLPQKNIKAVMSCAVPIAMKAGETVIRQGDEGSDYYIITSGRCQVIKRVDDSNHAQVLAELTDGDAFGEEALIAQSPRNASVLMKEDGTLLRLKKDDFSQFLQSHFVDYVDLAQAKELLATGAQWLDVRSPREHECNDLGFNIPLNTLRFQTSELDKNTTYIIYCSDGKKSAAASFILNQKGYKTRCLLDGLERYQDLRFAERATAESELALYKDMLIELTVNSQKEIRRLKAQHSKELEQLQQKYHVEQPQLSQQADLLKRISSLEKTIERHRHEMSKLIEEKNSYEVKSLAQQQLIESFCDLKTEYDHIENEYKKTLNQLLDTSQQLENAKSQYNDLAHQINIQKQQLTKLNDVENKFATVNGTLCKIEALVHACAVEFSLTHRQTLDSQIHDLIDQLKNKTKESDEQAQTISALRKEKEDGHQTNVHLEHIIKNKAINIAKLRQDIHYLNERLETSDQMIKILEFQMNHNNG